MDVPRNWRSGEACQRNEELRPTLWDWATSLIGAVGFKRPSAILNFQGTEVSHCAMESESATSEITISAGSIHPPVALWDEGVGV